MKKFSILFLALCLATGLNAQTDNTKGQIIYETVRKFDLKIQGDAAQFQNMIPKERKGKKELLFTSEASIYQKVNQEQEDEVMQESAGGANVTIKMTEPNEVIFCDLKNKTNFEQREFMSRTFLVEVKTDTVQWKLTGNQKAILEYSCMEAELVGAKKKTIAWFAPAIPVSTGPDGFVGLPGLILAIDIDNGKTTYTAQVVNFKEIDASLISKPKEGKKVSKKEFRKIVEEKTKEMNGGKPGDGGTTVIIRTM